MLVASCYMLRNLTLGSSTVNSDPIGKEKKFSAPQVSVLLKLFAKLIKEGNISKATILGSLQTTPEGQQLLSEGVDLTSVVNRIKYERRKHLKNLSK